MEAHAKHAVLVGKTEKVQPSQYFLSPQRHYAHHTNPMDPRALTLAVRRGDAATIQTAVQ